MRELRIRRRHGSFVRPDVVPRPLRDARAVEVGRAWGEAEEALQVQPGVDQGRASPQFVGREGGQPVGVADGPPLPGSTSLGLALSPVARDLYISWPVAFRHLLRLA